MIELKKKVLVLLGTFIVIFFAQVHASDLIVKTIDLSGTTGNWQTLEISGTIIVEIENLENDFIYDPFDIRLFRDSNGNAVFDEGTDLLLGTASQEVLNAGETAQVSIPILTTILFRDDLIYAEVDSGYVVAESVENNNISNTGLACEYSPVAGDFAPGIEWAWIDTVGVGIKGSMMTPVVSPLIDTNGDGKVDDKDIPAIIIIADGYRLVAVRGDGGGEIFQVNNPTYRVGAGEGYSQIAVGDIDGDQLPEIITVPTGGGRLIAFENDGTFKWFSSPISSIGYYWYGGPSLADMDNDGSPEIIYGSSVLNGNGTVRWQGVYGRGSNSSVGPLSAVADVDMDGSPDVVTGNTVYNADGTVQWNMPLPDGFVAVGNFDADPYPEIAVVASGGLRLLEHDGTVKWGPIALPGGGRGGAPTVADVDDDGLPEIGVAGSSRYTVFETDGSIKWSSVTRDYSSNMTGSSVFDFEADGSTEVVYNDELYLRIYRGSDGKVLFQTPNSSGTLLENPVIADVDRDGNAEIVVIRNNWGGYGSSVGLTEFGVFVYGDASDNWVTTRGIWNQHTYHITNVNNDASIPVVETNSWASFNNYRQNVQTPGSPLGAPDLTSSYLRTVNDLDLNVVLVTSRIGNGGAIHVNAGVPVSFYDGDPSLGGTLLGTANTTIPLEPGTYEDVTLQLPIATTTASSIWVVPDDSGDHISHINECNEASNTYDSGLSLPKTTPVALDDFFTSDEDTLLAVASPGVLGNDSDEDGDPISASLLSGPSNGTVVMTPDGSFSYVPAPNFYGSDSFTYTVSDPDTWFDTATVTVTVNSINDVPVADAGGPYFGEAGTPLDFNGNGSSDVEGAVVLYDWDFGDGNTGSGATISHVYAEAGNYTVTLTVSDADGASSSDTTSASIAEPANQAPIPDAGGPYAVNEGGSIVLSGSATDPDGDPITYDWDLNNDGVFETPGQSPVFSAAGLDGPAANTVTLRACDSAALCAQSSAMVNVTNIAPLLGPISTSGPLLADTEFITGATFTDPGTSDTHSALWDWGDGSSSAGTISEVNGVGSIGGSHNYVDPDTYTITLTLTDDDGGSSSVSTSVVIAPQNQYPTANAGGPYSVNEGGSVVLGGSATDPDGDPITYDWDLNNDGAYETPGQSPVFSAVGLDGPATFTVRLRACDNSGYCSISDSSVNVNNVAPIIGPISPQNELIGTNSVLEVSLSFTDPGTPDTHTLLWDWGDGTSSEGVVSNSNGTGSAIGTHIYESTGVFTLSATLTDDDGGSDQTFYQFIVVYDTGAGFVTGGGWIDSPAGACQYALCTADSTGKAKFGFVSKYKKGATAPTGQTQFQFSAGDLNFHSDSYQWLVVAGSNAKYKGDGKINGTGDYGFMITATDGQFNGADKEDKFRIKIWDKNNADFVVYDNLMGGADDSYEGTDLAGGNIMIHAL